MLHARIASSAAGERLVGDDYEGRRRCVATVARRRLHQRALRERTPTPRGPVISNGLALCRLHHAARTITWPGSFGAPMGRTDTSGWQCPWATPSTPEIVTGATCIELELPRLATHLSALNPETVFDRGWSGLTNGELLVRASADFDVFLTADQNVEYQQNLAAFDIGVVVLAAYTNRLADLIPLVPRAEAACREVAPGEVRIVRDEDRGRAT